MMVTRRLPWDGREEAVDELLDREWLVTNGLGGYAGCSLIGACTRKYHGLLVSAMPAPYGRVVMLTHLDEELRLADRSTAELGAEERSEQDRRMPGAAFLTEFRLEMGLPVWRYDVRGTVIEKRVLMPHRQNTVYVSYRLVSGDGPVRIRLWPSVHFHLQAEEVGDELEEPYTLRANGSRYEIHSQGDLPPLRLYLYGEQASFNLSGGAFRDVFYRVEHRRHDASASNLWSPGFFRVILSEGQDATLVASTEGWDTLLAMDPAEAFEAVSRRRQRLLAAAHPLARAEPAAELVLAADQFIVTPMTRVADAAWAHAAGDEVRTVMAGYHWFTDWGRDTMISLEGLTLLTGRTAEAGYILRSFAHYVRDGLIPNLFPEGNAEGLYHTADATLWFFHAIDRYVAGTGDRMTLRHLLPTLLSILDHHVQGTRFGIGVDPDDALLRQGAPGYQLTWMDAKVGDWVVTPRRGKAVEINALWYNALRLLAAWVREEQGEAEARPIDELADRAQASFNRRFWYGRGGYLYDVIDTEEGEDDTALRPNQIFALALRHPVLEPDKWERVLNVVQQRLLTPLGLRTLASDHPAYRSRYFGDLRSRDAAYHQGTVWPWLMGPFTDAWICVHPDDRRGARRFLEGLIGHLDDACLGTVSEIFDAEPPFRPGGCVSQAWSVAELLRVWVKTAESDGSSAHGAGEED